MKKSNKQTSNESSSSDSDSNASNNEHESSKEESRILAVRLLGLIKKLIFLLFYHKINLI